jgi:hypothetical protein
MITGPWNGSRRAKAQGIWHEAAQLLASTMQAEPADDALAIQEGVARQVRERRAPLIKARLIEILPRSLAEECPQRL